MPLPTFQTRDDVMAYCRGQLTRAVPDANHPWHWPALATAPRPAARIIVLRAYEPVARLLRFYTDARSDKVAQLDASGGDCELLFYHGRHRTQLRVRGMASPLVDEPTRQRLWAAQSASARRNYATVSAPGTPEEQPSDGLGEGTLDLGGAYANFGVYDVLAYAADFLQLGHDGQRRCRWSGDWDAAQVRWVTP